VLTQRKGSARPEHIWPEIWDSWSRKRQLKAIEEDVKAKAEHQAKQTGAVPAPLLADAAVTVALASQQYDEFHSSFVGIPAMPTVSDDSTHRPKVPDFHYPFNACVARPVNKAEIAKAPAAQASLDVEWNKLVTVNVWDQSQAFEWSDIAHKARTAQQTVHVGRLFEICVEKGSELPAGNPGRNYKGRTVFQGNRVVDQSWDNAIFQELGSAPAAMSATKMCDAYGLMKGHSIETADAEQAYINAKLEGAPTYVRLPRERLPSKWKHMKDPVFRLVLALYGHPDSGGHWEAYCEKMLESLGWVQIGGGWPSCFWHPARGAMLVVYVDDFRMAGPAANIPLLWADIRTRIKFGEAERSGKFLGCECTLLTRDFPAGGTPGEILHPFRVKSSSELIAMSITWSTFLTPVYYVIVSWPG
jgi:hypothetical protein